MCFLKKWQKNLNVFSFGNSVFKTVVSLVKDEKGLPLYCAHTCVTH